MSRRAPVWRSSARRDPAGAVREAGTSHLTLAGAPGYGCVTELTDFTFAGAARLAGGSAARQRRPIGTRFLIWRVSGIRITETATP